MILIEPSHFRRHAAGALAVSALTAGLVLGTPDRVHAKSDLSLLGDYNLSIAGLPFAKAKMSMAIKGRDYAAQVKIETWGIAKLVVESKSHAKASGRFGRNTVRPTRYSMDSKTRKLTTNVRMRLSGGSIRDLSARPALRKLPDRVAVTSRHKANVLDPLSAAIVPYRSKGDRLGKDACKQRIPIFDGWTRYDVKLYFRRFENVRTAGYTGPAAVCGARWVPVAGHRPNKKTVIYLRENKNLETWLVPAPGNKFLIPYRISIGTKSGVLLIKNKNLQFTGGGEKHAARR
ncbi:MAG: DUF3108 domain-containing protein [Pseudomonadota bacterium]